MFFTNNGSTANYGGFFDRRDSGSFLSGYNFTNEASSGERLELRDAFGLHAGRLGLELRYSFTPSLSAR